MAASSVLTTAVSCSAAVAEVPVVAADADVAGEIEALIAGEVAAQALDPANAAEVAAALRPIPKAYSPENFCCNAPNPPGALGNTDCCEKETLYFRQRWYCTWHKTAISCCGRQSDNAPIDPVPPALEDCAWTKVWRCGFEKIKREEVLKCFCKGQPPACPHPTGGECECWVPGDQFFAQIFETEYTLCKAYDPKLNNQCPPCAGPSQSPDAVADSCACCGVYEKCVPKIVRIRSRKEIPPLYPHRPAAYPVHDPPPHKPKPQCQTPTCRLGPAMSPNLYTVLPY